MTVFCKVSSVVDVNLHLYVVVYIYTLYITLKWNRFQFRFSKVSVFFFYSSAAIMEINKNT